MPRRHNRVFVGTSMRCTGTQILSRQNLKHGFAFRSTGNWRHGKCRNPHKVLTALGGVMRKRLEENPPRKLETPIRRPKHQDPRYALTIIGRLIRRRIERCRLFARGMSLVKQLSSCSLSCWSERSLGSVSFWSRGEKSGTIDDDAQVSNSHLAFHDKGVQYDGPDSNRPAEMACCSGMNSNLNATKHDASSNASKHVRPSLLPRLRRKGAHRRGLVARSIGRPKIAQQTKRKGNKFCLCDLRSRRAKKLKFLRKRCARLKKNEQLEPASGAMPEEHGRSRRRRSPPQQDTSIDKWDVPGEKEVPCPQEGSSRVIAASAATAVAPTSSTPCKQKSPDALQKRKDGRKKKRKRRKKEGLINQLIAGPSSATPWEGKEKRIQRRCKLSRQPRPCPEQSFTKSISHSSIMSLHPCAKSGSTDSVDWPSLPQTGRPKGLIKDTAKEIVKCKQGGSVTKITRKRWADIVAARTKEESPKEATAKKSQEKCMNEQRTWASVAANLKDATAQNLRDTSIDTSNVANRENEPSESPKSMSSSNTSLNGKLKRKSGSRLAYTDRLWANGAKGKGKPQSQRFYRKHYGDCAERERKRDTVRSRRTKTSQRTGQTGQEKTSSVIPKRVKANEAEQPSTSWAQETVTPNSEEHVNGGRQNWRIDNMSVVYTQPVGPVISLNEPREARTKYPRGVNKCNNRAVTPSKTKATLARANTKSAAKEIQDNEDPMDSGMDLCDRLSSFSFQSSDGSSDNLRGRRAKPNRQDSATLRQKTPRNKSQLTSKEASKSCQDDREPCRQKKISKRYRALLRGDGGRLDAKAVTEIHTRSKRTDNLLQDKVVTRAMQRQQRQLKQRTQHNSQRSPSIVTADRPTKNINSAKTATAKTSASMATPGPSKNVTSQSSEGSSSQTDKEEAERIWRPTDNSGANNSLARGEKAGSAQKPFLSRLSADMRSPMYARSAPELAKRQSNICVELHPLTSDSLDMGWWHAYFTEPDAKPEQRRYPLKGRDRTI